MEFRWLIVRLMVEGYDVDVVWLGFFPWPVPGFDVLDETAVDPLEALPSEVNRVLEPLIRFTREEAEADTDRMDGMVRAMLLEESPQESVNPTCRLARGV